MTTIAFPRTTRRLRAERLHEQAALREAQALRYRVFSSEFGARMQGAEAGLDSDDFDAHCSHIGVRDLDSGELVATTRLLDNLTARRLGRFCRAWRSWTHRFWRSAAPASIRPTATERPSPCSGPSWLKP